MSTGRYGDYGGGGGSGGGGFFPGSQGSQGSGGKGGRDRSVQTLRPVTIRQLLDAEQPHPDGEFALAGHELNQVTFIGTVRNLSKMSTNTSLSIEDGTGSIDVRHWFDSDGPGAPDDVDDDQGGSGGGAGGGWKQNDCVRVVGQLKAFSNKRYVNSMRLKHVEDPNELNFHFLDAIRVTLYFERGPPGGSGPSAYKAQSAAPAALDAGASAGAADFSDLPPLQRQIMQFISQAVNDGNESGPSLGEITRAVGAPQGNVQEQTDKLVEYGHLYTTIDVNHFLPTSV